MTSAAARLFTPAEAGAVSGLGLKAVHNAIDKRIVEPVRAPPRKAAKPVKPFDGAPPPSRRMLTGEDLVRLRLWYGVGAALSAERRQRLYREMAERPAARTVKADDLLIVDVAEARRQVAGRLKDLEAADNAIHKDPGILGGEPVFKGTRIPVYAVAAMLDAGAEEAELLAGYPNLDTRKLALARIWASAHPRRGRPRSLSDFGFKLKSSTRRTLGSDPLPATAS